MKANELVSTTQKNSVPYILQFLWVRGAKKNIFWHATSTKKNFHLYKLQSLYPACLKTSEMFFSQIHNSYSNTVVT
jgi:hypothetical protein